MTAIRLYLMYRRFGWNVLPAAKQAWRVARNA